jgi:deoxyribodipyrimidine photolyase-related protein
MGTEPWGGKWNYDKQNQQGAAKGLQAPEVQLLAQESQSPLWAGTAGAKGSRGSANPKADQISLGRHQSRRGSPVLPGSVYLEQKDGELRNLPGRDAYRSQPFLYHSLLSFAMNTKMLSPRFVIERCLRHYLQQPRAPPAT